MPSIHIILVVVSPTTLPAPPAFDGHCRRRGTSDHRDHGNPPAHQVRHECRPIYLIFGPAVFNRQILRPRYGRLP